MSRSAPPHQPSIASTRRRPVPARRRHLFLPPLSVPLRALRVVVVHSSWFLPLVSFVSPAFISPGWQKTPLVTSPSDPR